MLRPRWIVGFSGHRDQFDVERVRVGLREALAELRKRCEARGGHLELYGSAARGCDLLVASLAHELALPYHVVLPLPEADFAADFEDDPKSSWDNAQATIERARKGVEGGTLRISKGARERPHCYYDAGIDVVRACDVLLVVWDGQDAAGLGGTGDVVAQAKAEKVPVVVVGAANGAVDLSGLGASWPEREERFEEILGWVGWKHGDQEDFARLAQSLDDLATREARRFRPGVVLAITLHGFAALVAAGTTTWMAHMDAAERHGHGVALAGLTGAELTLVLGALFIVARQWLAHTHHKWLDARFAAEILRGLQSTRGLVDPLDPHVTHHAEEWRRLCVSAGLLARRGIPSDADWIALRKRYVDERVGGQITHFREKGKAARLTRGIASGITLACAVLAAVCVGLSLANKLFWHLENGWAAVWFVWMPIALPLVAGIAAGLRTALDASRRASRYRNLEERLGKVRDRMEKLRTRTAVEATVHDCEEILVDENLEWYLATSDVEAH